MSSLAFEKNYPYILGLLVAVLWYQLGIQMPFKDSFLSASLTIGAILSGFMATSKAILMTLDSPVMQRIRNSGYVEELVAYLAHALWLSFSFSIISLIGFFLETSSADMKLYYGLVWVFFGVSASVAFIRITNLMLKIIKYQKL